MKYCWVIYDISLDRPRRIVAKRCKQSGLFRVQKSVFLGKMSLKTLNKLRTDFNRIVNWRTDKVFFVPVTQSDYNRITKTGYGKKATNLIPLPDIPFIY